VQEAGETMLEWVEDSRPVWSRWLEFWPKVATTAVGLLAVWLLAHVLFGTNGVLAYQKKRSEYKRLQSETQAVQQENEKYQQRIQSLRNDPAAIEKEARERLHYTKPGEIVYVAPSPAAPPVPRNRSAQK
jgi:cell division protein FtsB